MISGVQEGRVCNLDVVGQGKEGQRNMENNWESYFNGPYSIRSYDPYAVILSSMR